METSPKSTLTLLGGSRPGKDSPARPHFPPADLQTSFHGPELSLAEPPEALGPPSNQAFLSFSTAPMAGGGLPAGEDPGPLLTDRGAPPNAGLISVSWNFSDPFTPCPQDFSFSS